MKVGLIVDGQAEYSGIPRFIARVQTQADVLSPIYCDMQPFAPPGQIALSASKKFGILLGRGCSKIVVLIDREERQDCAPDFRKQLEREMRKRLKAVTTSARLQVVVKERLFENWLVADPDACRPVVGTKSKIETLRRHVAPNKADTADALSLLKQHSRTKQYEKRRDGKAICERLDPDAAAANSRSFRRFLRVLGHPDYRRQSKRPKRGVT